MPRFQELWVDVKGPANCFVQHQIFSESLLYASHRGVVLGIEATEVSGVHLAPGHMQFWSCQHQLVEEIVKVLTLHSKLPVLDNCMRE